MYIVRVQDTFCAAHAVTVGDTQEALHGHNWRVECAVACPTVDAGGIAIDFCAVRDALHDELDTHLDHRNLADIAAVRERGATSEAVCAWIAERMTARVKALRSDAHIAEITVWETPSFGITYYPQATKND